MRLKTGGICTSGSTWASCSFWWRWTKPSTAEICYFDSRFYAVVPLKPMSVDAFDLPAANPLDGRTVQFTRDPEGLGLALQAGARSFRRQFYAPEKGEIYTVQLQRPVAELRPLALAARPPVESGDRLQSDLVEVNRLDASIRVDLRYATPHNFMGAALYSEPRAFLLRPAAEALVRVNQQVRPFGYGLLVHDAYRPWYVTWMFWEATPPEKRNFVADPQKGSRHNRGAAVDLSLCDLKTGQTADFGAGYDEFSERSFIDYPGGSSAQRWRRQLLAFYMTRAGFDRYHDEWWHFDLLGWDRYPILNAPFDQIPLR